MTKETRVEPIDDLYQDRRTHLTVAATYKDPNTRALFVHKDLVQTLEPFAEEAHIPPMRVSESFGDVDSFVLYVSRYADSKTTFLSWNSGGVRAVLDYADDASNAPGRCQWIAKLPFILSRQWQQWANLANGHSLAQKSAVETLEDLAADIIEPKSADLMAILRSLRATVNARADAELRPDGTAKISFEKDAKVQTANQVDLPAMFRIAIPVLKGHIDPETRRPVLYSLEVRIRVGVNDDAKLGLRFTMPNAERVLESVFEERVEATKAVLPDGFSLLRAAD